MKQVTDSLKKNKMYSYRKNVLRITYVEASHTISRLPNVTHKKGRKF